MDVSNWKFPPTPKEHLYKQWDLEGLSESEKDIRWTKIDKKKLEEQYGQEIAKELNLPTSQVKAIKTTTKTKKRKTKKPKRAY